MTQLPTPPTPGDMNDPRNFRLQPLPIGHPATGTMFKHHLRMYNAMVREINKMEGAELDVLISIGQCPFKSELLRGFGGHVLTCPLCGVAINQGETHPVQPTDLTQPLNGDNDD